MTLFTRKQTPRQYYFDLRGRTHPQGHLSVLSGRPWRDTCPLFDVVFPPLLLPPLMVPCKMGFLRGPMIVKRGRTTSVCNFLEVFVRFGDLLDLVVDLLVDITLSLYKMRNIFRKQLMSMACILHCRSAERSMFHKRTERWTG